ncbi:MAG: cyclomaltodextrinase N-terminal domain-containing protein [bacterium]
MMKRGLPVILREMRFPQTKSPGLLLAILILASICGTAQTSVPQILKVEPASWWAGSSVSPLRLLIRGSNLKGARVQGVGRGFTIVGAPKTNERGTYLFVDVAIDPRAHPGARQLKITTAKQIVADRYLKNRERKNGRFK